MIFDVKKIEEYIRSEYDVEGDIEIFMNADVGYDIYFRPKDEDKSYLYLKLEEYKSYLRDEKLKDLGI